MMEKKIMLITGTRKGIGKYLAEYYIKRDYFVIGCSRQETDLKDENYRHYCLDIADEEKVKIIFRDIQKDFGQLDVLINNAGIASMNHSLLTPISTVRKILDTNVVGNFLFSREAAKIMKKKNFGRIVNFVTFAIPFKLEGEAIYAASKAAVATLTEILSREYAPFNITVNAVAPPAVKTDLIRGVADDKMNNLLRRQSIHRYGTPEEVCAVIDFFIQPENEMINGQIIYMGGL
jgi:3-oxoacyl-[acyl-carrier protein] reductase